MFFSDEDKPVETNNTIPNFDMRSALLRCRAWDRTHNRWTGQYCKVTSHIIIVKILNKANDEKISAVTVQERAVYVFFQEIT